MAKASCVVRRWHVKEQGLSPSFQSSLLNPQGWGLPAYHLTTGVLQHESMSSTICTSFNQATTYKSSLAMTRWASGVCDEAGGRQHTMQLGLKYQSLSASPALTERLDNFAAAVKQAGGEVLPGACGIRLHGWTITSRKAPISSAHSSAYNKPKWGACRI